MQPESLVERRKSEAFAAAAVAGVECQVDILDGHLEATLENRLKVIRQIREFKPDLVITNRPNDYHADHRYTSQLVQDASFLLMVPNVAPEVAAMDTMPVITYFSGMDFKSPVHSKPISLWILRAFLIRFANWLPTSVVL